MNNYSAESSTNETLKFLEKLLSKAVGHLNKKETELDALFNDAKDYVSDTTQDDERLIELLENDGRLVIWDNSEYTRWNDLPWLTRQFTPQPADDREKHRKKTVKTTANDTRFIINNTLDELETLENFYNNLTRLIMRNNYGPREFNFDAGYELTLIIINKKLPKNMHDRYNNLAAFSNNINTINKMYKSFTIHDFETVSIEENMLKTIDLVQRYMVE